ncbi:hypothetical protein CVT26_015639 [Gymnopilus dilepis]|uniref:Uncharacterized protein n=1 Tax=Gymnopilus dilepis TaxID=231916 RepID=A0A409YDE8_9AGAR|nr:hypothetical protein CVT26_015639 [Gymnopilus dilepis]
MFVGRGILPQASVVAVATFMNPNALASALAWFQPTSVDTANAEPAHRPSASASDGLPQRAACAAHEREEPQEEEKLKLQATPLPQAASTPTPPPPASAARPKPIDTHLPADAQPNDTRSTLTVHVLPRIRLRPVSGLSDEA